MGNAVKAMSLFLLLHLDSRCFLFLFSLHFRRARANWGRIGCEKIEGRRRGGEAVVVRRE